MNVTIALELENFNRKIAEINRCLADVQQDLSNLEEEIESLWDTVMDDTPADEEVQE